jgi:CyaY protein
VVSPNSPVRQIWVSAHSKSFKLDWDPAQNAFVLPETGESLKQLIEGAVSRQLGEPVEL